MAKKRGQRGKLTPELAAELARYIRGGLTNKDACAIVGIVPATLYHWLAEPRTDAENDLFYAIEKAKVERKAVMVQTITKAAQDGTWQAAAWYLERQYPEEYAKPDRYHDQGIAEAVNAVKELTESIKAKADAADR